jgi:hypothetical protein
MTSVHLLRRIALSLPEATEHSTRSGGALREKAY